MTIDFNTPLSALDRSSRQKTNKETWDLICTIDQVELIDTYKKFHTMAAECTFFYSTHGSFSRMDHVLGHRTSLKRFKGRPSWVDHLRLGAQDQPDQHSETPSLKIQKISEAW